MPFWKKSEDPWDIDPSRRPAPEPAEKSPGLTDTLREGWNTMREQRKEKQEKLRLPPEKCPWCGKDMEQGFLSGVKGGVFWQRGVPTGKALWLGAGSENTIRVDTEGILSTYHTAWYCPDCKRMTIDASDLQTEAEKNQAAFPAEAENRTEQSEETKEGE